MWDYSEALIVIVMCATKEWITLENKCQKDDFSISNCVFERQNPLAWNNGEKEIKDPSYQKAKTSKFN